MITFPGTKRSTADFAYLFNSYYEAEGSRHARNRRGMITRPSLEQVRDYRAHVDTALGAAWLSLPPEAQTLVELGCHHEAQHQELLLTDLLHLMSLNPTDPAVWPRTPQVTSQAESLGWVEGRTGLVEIGHDGGEFAFDCEGPRHTVYLAPHALADRLVTNGEWQDFIDAGGYCDASLWLSDGWAWVLANGIEAPLHWRDDWQQFGLDGLTPPRPRRARHAYQPLRSRRLRELERVPPADRSGMGIGGRRSRSGIGQSARQCRPGQNPARRGQGV